MQHVRKADEPVVLDFHQRRREVGLPNPQDEILVVVQLQPTRMVNEVRCSESDRHEEIAGPVKHRASADSEVLRQR
ncbi:hypothetical protein Amsp01_074270 [Amycolatopsis sp. NBRC 101858]|nr:hypothetical protein Amsp01_074270 [Amycolatopsis sp. NBRC 101858]